MPGSSQVASLSWSPQLRGAGDIGPKIKRQNLHTHTILTFVDMLGYLFSGTHGLQSAPWSLNHILSLIFRLGAYATIISKEEEWKPRKTRARRVSRRKGIIHAYMSYHVQRQQPPLNTVLKIPGSISIMFPTANLSWRTQMGKRNFGGAAVAEVPCL